MTSFNPRPDAPEGEVVHLRSYSKEHFPPGCVILCRNSAPLIAFAYELVERGVPCHVLGKNVGAQLIALVKKLKPENTEDLRSKVATWAYDKSAELEAKGHNPDNVHDQASCILHICRAYPGVPIPMLLLHIEKLFSDDRQGGASKVVLSTIHKAKGLEWDLVYLLDFFELLPSPRARLRWELQQERNLQYVAVTRAKNKLVFIASACWYYKTT